MKKKQATPGPKLYDQQPGESIKAFTAFRTYLDLGAERSIVSAGRKLGKNRVTLEQWSTRWRWVERSKAWDIDQEQQRRQLEEAAMKDQSGVWAKRMLEQREADYQIAVALREKAKAMLDFPIAKRVVMEGTNQVHIHPAKFSFGQAATMMRVSTELARLACGMATEKTEISGPDNQPLASGQVVILELPDNGRTRKSAAEEPDA